MGQLIGPTVQFGVGESFLLEDESLSERGLLDLRFEQTSDTGL